MTEYSIRIHLLKMKNKILWVHTLMKYAVHVDLSTTQFQ
jgi:hypothetical protein